MMKKPLALGAFLMLTGIALGAFGAHAFRPTLLAYQTLAIWQTAVDYQMWHGISLLALAGSEKHLRHPLYPITAWMILVGVLLFSGSLYVLALTGIKTLGIITPIGGIFLLMAWVIVLWITLNKQ